MLVYLVALLEALVYLSAIPVCAAFWVSSEGRLRAGVGVGIFEERFALRQAQKNKLGFEKQLPERKGRLRLSLALGLLRRLRPESVSLRGSLGLGDAAATAMACGALQAVAAALAARAGRVELSVAPDFGSDGPRVRLQGMLTARSGQIILAAAKSGLNSISTKGGAHLWKSIRSKA